VNHVPKDVTVLGLAIRIDSIDEVMNTTKTIRS
jgi:hypothetical protein